MKKPTSCVFEYKTAIQRTSVLVVRRGSAEVLRSVMFSDRNSSNSNQRTFDILTSSWNQINFAGLVEIGECNDESERSSINEDENCDTKVNSTFFSV